MEGASKKEDDSTAIRPSDSPCTKAVASSFQGRYILGDSLARVFSQCCRGSRNRITALTPGTAMRKGQTTHRGATSVASTVAPASKVAKTQLMSVARAPRETKSLTHSV